MKVGNLFELAEKQLQKEKAEGIIPCYTMLDVIEYAVQIRKWLDKNENNIVKFLKLSPELRKRKAKEDRHKYYLMTGR
jgi:hypothetical protein